jgi:hypothetical protein
MQKVMQNQADSYELKEFGYSPWARDIVDRDPAISKPPQRMHSSRSQAPVVGLPDTPDSAPTSLVISSCPAEIGVKDRVEQRGERRRRPRGDIKRAANFDQPDEMTRAARPDRQT